MPEPIAKWNSARDVWETPGTANLFCEHSDVYSETWPTSGTCINGVAYALPTWEPRTDVSESSSLLLTPVAAEGTKPSNTMGVARRQATGQAFLTNQIVTLCGLDPSEKLLPTPCASVANDGEGTETWLARRERVKETAANGNGMGMPLTIAVQLLPTPVAQPSGNTPENHLRKKPGREVVTDLAILVENDLLSTGGRTHQLFVSGEPCEEPTLPMEG